MTSITGLENTPHALRRGADARDPSGTTVGWVLVFVGALLLYGLTAEMWALCLWDRTRRSKWLVLMFLANGLALANHDLALLTLPVIGTVLLLAIKGREALWRTLFACACSWIVGCSIYLYMIARE